MLNAESKQTSASPCLNTAETRELTRLAYLDSMGIQTWFPRKTLINAQPARLFEWLTEKPEPRATTAQPKPVPKTERVEHTTTPAPTSQHPSSKDILNIVNNASLERQEETTSKKPIPVQLPEIISDAKPTISTFRLSIVPLDPNCLVVAEMPYTGMNPFSQYHYRLLHDLARAINHPLVTEFHAVREFTWPLTSATAHSGLFSQISQDDQAATDAIQAYLNNQFGLARRQIVLLLGQAAAHFVYDRSRSFEELRGIHTTEVDKQIVAISHGLNEMMKIPSLKAETWQDLQQLQFKNFIDTTHQ